MKQIDWIKTGKEIGLTALLVVITAALLCCLIGVMILKEWISLDNASIAVMIVFNLLLLLGCWINARTVKQGKLIVSLLTALASVLLCILTKAIAFPEGEWKIEWALLLPFLIASAVGIAVSGKKQYRK